MTFIRLFKKNTVKPDRPQTII